ETQGLVDRLVDRALALQDDRGRLSLHYVCFDFVRMQWSKDHLPTLHNRLLNAYAKRCLSGWASGPHDGYFFEHLAYHLVSAGRAQDLRALLLDCDWMQAKVKATDVTSLIADYDLLPDDSDLLLVQGTLRLSEHILVHDLAQLYSQVVGRLLSHPS